MALEDRLTIGANPRATVCLRELVTISQVWVTFGQLLAADCRNSRLLSRPLLTPKSLMRKEESTPICSVAYLATLKRRTSGSSGCSSPSIFMVHTYVRSAPDPSTSTVHDE